MSGDLVASSGVQSRVMKARTAGHLSAIKDVTVVTLHDQDS